MSAVARSAAAAGRRRIFVECTHTCDTPLNTGIQRVVRNILLHVADVARDRGCEAVPVVARDGKFVRVPPESISTIPPVADRPDPTRALPARIREGVAAAALPVLQRIAAVLPLPGVRRFLLAPGSEVGLAWFARLPWRALKALRHGARIMRQKVVLALFTPHLPPGEEGFANLDQFASHGGNVLLLLDCSWGKPLWPIISRFKAAGGSVVTVLYDLIPITHPQCCVAPNILAFEDWLAQDLIYSDAFIGISRSVADDLRTYLRRVAAHGEQPRLAPVGHFHLGSELAFTAAPEPVRDSVRALFDSPQHVFLTVGSIEPRKNHAYILDAFDDYWAGGGLAHWVIVGQHGWMNEAFLARVAAHPQRDRRLHLLRDAADGELDFAYRNASGLVFASMIEGFGLPIAEAFQRGLPVLCSDIPVFREIADGRATFFDLDEPRHLTAALQAFCASHDPTLRTRRAPQAWINWHQSTEQLIDATLAVGGQLRTVAALDQPKLLERI